MAGRDDQHMHRSGDSGSGLRPSRTAIAAGAVSAALMLAALDYVTGSEVAFSLFYLAPIAVATWYVGAGTGLLLAVGCALLWGVSDVAGGAQYSSQWIPVWNTGIRFGFFITTLYLFSRLRNARDRDQFAARTDGLTGTLNARAFYAELEREIERSKRTGDPFVLVYADLDHFKSVNDTLGHPAGDRLLRDVAEAVQGSLRVIDTVARVGGDEMALLLPETDQGEADSVLERVREAVTNAVKRMPGVPEEVGLTAGAVVFLSPPNTSDDAIRVADALMYEGKSAGRGRTLLKTS